MGTSFFESPLEKVSIRKVLLPFAVFQKVKEESLIFLASFGQM